MALKDLILNYENKTITNQFVKGKNLIIQKVVLALQCWTGDWFLDGNFGIPYNLRLDNKSLLLADAQDIILSVDGVISVQNLDIKTIYIDESRKQKGFSITASITTKDEEQVILNGLIPVVGV